MEVVRTLSMTSGTPDVRALPRDRDPAPEPAFQFVQLLGLVRRRLLFILLVGALGAAGVFGAATHFRKYSAKALILVEPPSGITAQNVGGVPTIDEQAVIETHILTMLAPAGLSAMIASFAGDERPLVRPLDPIAVERTLKVQQELHSRVISVVFDARDATDAARVANRAAELYVAAQRRKGRDVLDQRLERMHARVTALQAAAGDQPASADAFDAVDPHRRLAESLILEGALRRQLAALDRDDAPSANISVLSSAPVPQRPSTGSPVVLAVPGFIAFAILAFFLALLLERGDRSLRSEREVEDVLGVPCLGLLPRLRGITRARPLARGLARTGGALSESVNGLLYDHVLRSDGLPTTILVTSALANEGKSSLAIALSAGAARLDRRTLLLDLDWRGTPLLKVPRACPGLPDFASGDEAYPTGVEVVEGLGFHRLAPWRSTAGSAEPPGKDVADLLAQLRGSYDLIVIDGPSLLGAAEAASLVPLADQVLLAVHWGRTRREFVWNALHGLTRRPGPRAAGTDRIGVVLTRVRLRRHALYRFGDRGEVLSRL